MTFLIVRTGVHKSLGDSQVTAFCFTALNSRTIVDRDEWTKTAGWDAMRRHAQMGACRGSIVSRVPCNTFVTGDSGTTPTSACLVTVKTYMKQKGHKRHGAHGQDVISLTCYGDPAGTPCQKSAPRAQLRRSSSSTLSLWFLCSPRFFFFPRAFPQSMAHPSS